MDQEGPGFVLSPKYGWNANRLKICHGAKSHVFISDLDQKFLLNHQILQNFCLWGWKAAALSLIYTLFALK